MGEKDEHVMNLVRNVQFEPSLNPKKDWVNSALREISVAFTFNCPVIISTHRLNFMGGLETINREKNLQKFSDLISRILKTYPDTEFINTVDLVDIINNNENTIRR
jgi:hypothetical protein